MTLFTIQTNLSNMHSINERRRGEEIQNSRTGEYALLLGFVFVAAIITMATIGTQVAQLISISSGA